MERDGNEGALDDSVELLAAAEEELGATIMGRNVFGPIRGSWRQRPVVRLVGGRSAVPPPGVRAHAPPPFVHLDAARNPTFPFVDDGNDVWVAVARPPSSGTSALA
ncbi:MAG TPA: hypothetical protein VFH30_13875 [Acidimicrobiales bacterium]|nr:hypothetical protein [Acidimicrobiales bacterium]